MNYVFKGSAVIGAIMAATPSVADAHNLPDISYSKDAPVPAGMEQACTPSDLAYLREEANRFVRENNVEFGEKNDQAQGYMQAFAELHEGDNAYEAYLAYSERALSNFKDFNNVAKQVERGLVDYADVDQEIIGRINELGHLEQFYIQAHTAEKIAHEFEMHYGEGSFARYSGMDIELGEMNCEVDLNR